MKKQLIQLGLRFIANGFGLWVSYWIGLITIEGGVKSFVIAGMILSLLNAVLKPILIIFSLPLIAISLGFFLIIINALLLYILSILSNNIILEGIIYTTLAGMVISLVNYILTILFERMFHE